MAEEAKNNPQRSGGEELALAGMHRIVYVKKIAASDVPNALAQGLTENTPLYAICAADGTPLSIMDDRAAAFSGARQHNLEPVSVH